MIFFVAILILLVAKFLRMQALFVQRARNVQQLCMRSSVDPFWENGLKFGCTGCGKCCTNEGEVWFNTDEFSELATGLGLSAAAALDTYSETISSGWVKVKDGNLSHTKFSTSKCVFLDDLTGTKCTIYGSRPVQCRTYPYWPSLLNSEASWEDEAVLPYPVRNSISNGGCSESNIPVPSSIGAKYWSVQDGGCEGINHADAPVVAGPTIHLNQQLYIAYHRAFPRKAPATEPHNDLERHQLLENIDLIQRVVNSTRRWVEDFVIHYNLCPVAKQVQQQEQVRYRVCMETDRSKIIERFKLEVLDLMQQDEQLAATTLLALPLAFPSFPDFHAFSLDLEELVLPSIEAHNLGTPNSKYVEEPAIQLAFFHPGFEWASGEPEPVPVSASALGHGGAAAANVGSEEAGPGGGVSQSALALHFEKKAPFPTINLLRARQVRAAANQVVTSKISLCNEQTLSAVGAGALARHLSDLSCTAHAVNRADCNG